jgi:hypothetical protein
MEKIKWKNGNDKKLGYKYKGFDLIQFKKYPGKYWLIYQNGEQYSGLHLSSVEVACKIIDKHIEGKSLPLIKDITIKDLRPVAEYSNKGYNYLMQMEN